jgi:hypothetical protein
MPRRLLLLEFNELCPVLLQKWMAAGKLANFRAFYDQSQTYISLSPTPSRRLSGPGSNGIPSTPGWFSISIGCFD